MGSVLCHIPTVINDSSLSLHYTLVLHISCSFACSAIYCRHCMIVVVSSLVFNPNSDCLPMHPYFTLKDGVIEVVASLLLLINSNSLIAFYTKCTCCGRFWIQLYSKANNASTLSWSSQSDTAVCANLLMLSSTPFDLDSAIYFIASTASLLMNLKES